MRTPIPAVIRRTLACTIPILETVPPKTTRILQWLGTLTLECSVRFAVGVADVLHKDDCLFGEFPQVDGTLRRRKRVGWMQAGSMVTSGQWTRARRVDGGTVVREIVARSEVARSDPSGFGCTTSIRLSNRESSGRHRTAVAIYWAGSGAESAGIPRSSQGSAVDQRRVDFGRTQRPRSCCCGRAATKFSGAGAARSSRNHGKYGSCEHGSRQAQSARPVHPGRL